MQSSSPYDQFLERFGELADINGALALLSWDQETYMPSGAQQARARQMAALSAIAHQKMTSQEMGDLVAQLRSNPPESLDHRIAVERFAWDYDRATKIPEQLVRDLSQARSDGVACWSTARQENDFAKFLPCLRRLLELARQEADYLRKEGQSRYDALLEGYERGAKSEEIEKVFDGLRDAVVPLVQRIREKPGFGEEPEWLHRQYDEDRQWAFGIEILKAIGFDFETGRQDRSMHPFTSGFHPTDVRLTTRIMPTDPRSALFSSIHEGGHGLYEQGIAQEDYSTPLGYAISLGIHESQSRMWENLVGRGKPFWQHFLPKMRKEFPTQLESVSIDDFYRAVNLVKPSLIRVEADEVTYSLHIILRFELERSMLEGQLDPADLPAAWAGKMKRYLGLDVPNDKDGCMQDIHWAWGMFGYFPTYSLGNLYSVQFFEQARKDIPDLMEQFSSGRFTALTEWLRAKIHRVGMRRTASELVQDVTGHSLQAEPYIRYLYEKYESLYDL